MPGVDVEGIADKAATGKPAEGIGAFSAQTAATVAANGGRHR
jgi:hypothetical protein